MCSVIHHDTCSPLILDLMSLSESQPVKRRERDYGNSFIQSLTVAVYQTFQYMQTLPLKRTQQPTEEHMQHTACDPNICTWPCSDANSAHLIPTRAHFHFNTLSVLLSLLCCVSRFLCCRLSVQEAKVESEKAREGQIRKRRKRKKRRKKGGGRGETGLGYSDAFCLFYF